MQSYHPCMKLIVSVKVGSTVMWNSAPIPKKKGEDSTFHEKPYASHVLASLNIDMVIRKYEYEY